ncbi:MAG: hypothetical protein LLG06_06740 [Desulfobacteraceae bacterium]|nr:hypothetical protein [Desulfobacteraceae bacterium]
MSENRRQIQLNMLSGKGSLPDAQLASSYSGQAEAMEGLLRLEEQILSAARERQAVMERIQEQETLISRNAAQDRARESNAGEALEETDKLRDSFEQLRISSSGFLDETGSGMKNLCGNVFQTELSSAKSSWDSFCTSLLSTFTKMTSKMASSWLSDIIGGLFGSMGTGSSDSGSSVLEAELFHSGGISGNAAVTRMVDPLLFAGAPRLHSGLASDEFPAILQRGEAVIPKGQAESGTQSNLNVEVKIDNRSTTPIKLEQGSVSRDFNKMVINIVAKDIDEYGVLGKLIHGQKRS